MKYNLLIVMIIVFSSGCVNNKTTVKNQKQDAAVYNPTGDSHIKVDASVLYEALNDPNTPFLKQ